MCWRCGHDWKGYSLQVLLYLFKLLQLQLNWWRRQLQVTREPSLLYGLGSFFRFLQQITPSMWCYTYLILSHQFKKLIFIQYQICAPSVCLESLQTLVLDLNGCILLGGPTTKLDPLHNMHWLNLISYTFFQLFYWCFESTDNLFQRDAFSSSFATYRSPCRPIWSQEGILNMGKPSLTLGNCRSWYFPILWQLWAQSPYIF